MGKMKRYIGIIMLIVSLALTSYPLISNILYESEVSSAVQKYNKKTEETTAEELQENQLDIDQYNAIISSSRVHLTDPFIDETNNTLYGYKVLQDKSEIMAYLEIPTLSLTLPVFYGTKEDNLTRGVGHLNGTSIPSKDKTNHSVICGHTGYSKARLFTDLVELKKGDMFYITINKEKLAYTVDEIAITKPNDVSKLKIYENKNYVTLYTCTPYGQNTHRLLVRGHLTPYSEEKYEAQQKTFWDKIFQSSWFKEYYKAIIGGVLLVLIINVMYKKFSKGKK